MATFIIMGKFTPQGIRNVKETTTRSHRFREIAEGYGVKVHEIFWLMGDFDVINIVEAEDEKSVSALLLELGAWGNVSTTTYRAYTKEEMDAIIAKMDGVKK
ncbi:MAG: GYD domain-containing protein [Nitrospinaceae bacterium]